MGKTEIRKVCEVSLDIPAESQPQLHNRWHPDIPFAGTIKNGETVKIECVCLLRYFISTSNKKQVDWTGGQIGIQARLYLLMSRYSYRQATMTAQTIWRMSILRESIIFLVHLRLKPLSQAMFCWLRLWTCSLWIRLPGDCKFKTMPLRRANANVWIVPVFLIKIMAVASWMRFILLRK